MDSRYFWTHPISVGLQLSVPIFSGLTKMNKSRELKNQIAQISLQRDYARQQIDVQVRAALNELLTARETMFAQEKTVEQARQSVSSVLTVESTRLALIPTSGQNEVLTYEFLCSSSTGDKVLCYVDTQTGAEEQLLILLQTPNGMLTK